MVDFEVFAITALAATAFADVATFNNYASQGKYVFPFPNFHTKLSILTSPPI